MPLISSISRKSGGTRLLIWTIYLVLSLGMVTMIYPFLLMFAGTTKSEADIRESSVLPAFLYDDRALYRKHMEGLFNESVVNLQMAYDQDVSGFESTQLPDNPN